MADVTVELVLKQSFIHCPRKSVSDIVHAYRKKDLIVEGIVLKSQLKEGGERFEEWRRQVALAGGEDSKDILATVEKIV